MAQHHPIIFGSPRANKIAKAVQLNASLEELLGDDEVPGTLEVHYEARITASAFVKGEMFEARGCNREVARSNLILKIREKQQWHHEQAAALDKALEGTPMGEAG